MKMTRKGWFLLVSALLLAALVFTGCPMGDDDEDEPIKVPKTWTKAELPTITGGLSNIAYGKGVFVAATNANEIIWSADGVTWNKVDQDLSELMNTGANYVFFGGDGFVLVGRNNPGTQWASSSDGKTWTAVTGPGLRAAGSGVYGNSTWVIGSNGGNVVVGAGSTWQTKATDIAGINWVNGAAYGNGKFVITGMAGNAAYSADNGKTWVNSSPKNSEGNYLFGEAAGGSGNQSAINQVVFSQDKGLFIVVGGTPGQQQIAATSSDGIEWKQTGDIKITATTNYLYVGYGAGVFLIAHQNGGDVPASYSTDTITWTAINDIKLAGATGIAYGAGKFVMVSGAEIAYSIPEVE